MISRSIAVLTLSVAFLCIASGAEIRKILEDILEDRSNVPVSFRRPPPPPFKRPPPMPMDVCFYKGKVYKVRERFVDDSCTGYCRCRRGGGVACVSLCPPSWAECGPNEIEVTEKVPADREGKCFCHVPVCVENKGANVSVK